MSLRTEIEELVKWLSDAPAVPAAGVGTATPEGWIAVARELKVANARFCEASDQLRLPDVSSDGGQARSAETRPGLWRAVAHAVASWRRRRRSEPPAETGRAILAQLALDLGWEAGALELRAESILQLAGGGELPPDEVPSTETDAEKLVACAHRSIGNARDVLFDVQDANEATTRFRNDLDVLNELALGLRQELGWPHSG